MDNDSPPKMSTLFLHFSHFLVTMVWIFWFTLIWDKANLFFYSITPKACFHKRTQRGEEGKEVIAKCWNGSHISLTSQWALDREIPTNWLIGTTKGCHSIRNECVNGTLLRGIWSDEKYRFGMIELKPVWGGGLPVCDFECTCVCVCVCTLPDRVGASLG